MSDGGDSLSEKRVYAEARDATAVYVASTLGVVRVTVSGAQVGRVSLVHREPVADVAGADGRLLAAGEADVLVGTGEEIEPTGFGTAVAVGVGASLFAASPDGRVARLAGDDWRDVGRVAAPRAFDGAFLAAGSGVHRVGADGVEPLGLADVRDVAWIGADGDSVAGPYAATDDGLYRRDEAGAWQLERDEACQVVAAAAHRANLVADGVLFERRSPGEWTPCDLPADQPVVDVAHGEATYAVTADGTFLVDAPPEHAPDGAGGWRSRALGLEGVTGLAVT